MPGWPFPLHCHAEEKSWRHTAQEIHLPPTEGEWWAYIIMKVSQSAFVISCAGIVWTQKKNKNCEVYSIYSGRKLHEPYILDNGSCGKKYKHCFLCVCFCFFPNCQELHEHFILLHACPEVMLVKYWTVLKILFSKFANPSCPNKDYRQPSWSLFLGWKPHWRFLVICHKVLGHFA